MAEMEVLQLTEGWQVVLDVGHSAAVRGIDVHDDVIVTGGLDGAVFVRGEDGRSRVPPLHLPEVLCLAVVPGTDLVVIGTEGLTYGLDLASGVSRSIGGLDGVHVTSCVPIGDRVVLGCDDGSVRSIDAASPPRPLARFDAPVYGLAALDDAVVATFEDGHVRVLDLDGHLRAEVALSPAEVVAVATSPTTIVLGGSGEPAGGERLSGQLLALDHSGTEVGRRAVDVYVEALVCRGEDVFAMLGDGNLVATTTDLGVPAGVALREGVGTSTMVTRDGAVWVGGIDGTVTRLDPSHELPSRPSGVFAASVTEDQRTAVTVDGTHLTVWDLRTGERTHTSELPGVRAVTFAEDESTDVVVAYLDGRMERRAAPAYTEVTARGELAGRPRELGYVGPFVLAQGPGEDEVRMFDAEDFTELTPTPAALEDRCVMERRGFPFVGTGLLEGLELSVIESRDLVVERPGLLTATSGATPFVRLWDGQRFLR